MSNKIFQDYNNSGQYFTLEEVRERIEDLTSDLRGSESYYRRHQPEVLTKEQREDILLENKIQDEIDFYKAQIRNQEVFGTTILSEELEEEYASPLNCAALIKHYHNPSLSISIVEARQIISDLNDDLKIVRYYLKNKIETFTEKEKEQQQEKEVDIQHEIYYYETSIFRTQQAYKNDPQSFYGYSLRARTPSVSDSDSEDEVEEFPKPPTKIDSLEKKLEGVENVVYQLLGGLFNQETQSSILDSHLCCLRGNEHSGKINKDATSGEINEETIWPTTRQGDRNEEEIRILKQQVSKLEGTVEMLVRLLVEKLKN
jgi:hypothetical protein